MATVRITEQIRQDVRRKIDSLFDARIKKKLEELNHLDVAMQVFMKRITPEELTIACSTACKHPLHHNPFGGHHGY